MAWEWTAWFDEHAGAIAALAALGTLAFTAVLVFVSRRQVKIAERQAGVSERQADITTKQVDLQAAIHRKEGPILLLHFAGFQSRPEDPKQEMLWLMVGVGNEGRREVRVTHLEVLVDEPKQEGFHSYALYPRHEVGHGTDSRGHYEPAFPSTFMESLGDIDSGQKWQAGGVIKSHDAESFYVAIPGGSGYEKWKKVRLRVSGIGVEPATKDVDWNLWWLRRAGAT